MATNKTDSMLTVDKEIKELFKKIAKEEGIFIKHLARKLILNYQKSKK
jgi:hypothetical protein